MFIQLIYFINLKDIFVMNSQIIKEAGRNVLRDGTTHISGSDHINGKRLTSTPKIQLINFMYLNDIFVLNLRHFRTL